MDSAFGAKLVTSLLDYTNTTSIRTEYSGKYADT